MNTNRIMLFALIASVLAMTSFHFPAPESTTMASEAPIEPQADHVNKAPASENANSPLAPAHADSDGQTGAR